MRKRRAFTLIELLVVVAIIGILATVVVVNVSSAQNKARDSKVKADIATIQSAAAIYYQDYNSYLGLACSPVTGSTCESLSYQTDQNIKTIGAATQDIDTVNSNNSVFLTASSSNYRASANLPSTISSTNIQTFSVQGDGYVGTTPPISVGSFDGLTQFLSIPSNSTLQMNNTSFTVFGWFYFKSLPPNISASQVHLVNKWNQSTTQREYLLRCYNDGSRNNFRFDISNDGTNYVAGVSSVVPAINTWYFLVGWYDSSTRLASLQVMSAGSPSTNNTIATSTALAASSVLPGSSTFTIGKQSDINANYFNGSVSQVGLIKRLLTATEINQLYNNGNGLESYQFPTSLITSRPVAVWDFDQISGVTADSVGSNALLNNGNVQLVSKP